MTGRHRSPVAELDQHEADRLRRRARELVAEADDLPHAFAVNDLVQVMRWIGMASVILEELARG